MSKSLSRRAAEEIVVVEFECEPGTKYVPVVARVIEQITHADELCKILGWVTDRTECICPSISAAECSTCQARALLARIEKEVD